ncbi:MAG: hypothetical protein SGBAC_007642 [Bacillariaceae sp.]
MGKAPQSSSMDRGTSALKSHVQNCEQMEIRQTRRGFCQEIMGCDAKTEFKYFIGGNQIGTSLEDTDCFCRMFCNAIHPFKMVVKELNTDAEMVSVDRPLACVASGCKCCCYQEAAFTSGGEDIGSIKEECYYCVPRFTIFDPENKPMYKLHSPTCCGGMCVNCCAEGNPCGKGCCKVSFRIYDPDLKDTEGDAPYLGQILKKPKSAMVEIFTDAQTFIVDFPKDASPAQKGALIGTSIFLNAIFFEGEQD